MRGCRRTQRGCDCLQDSIDISEHVVISGNEELYSVLNQPLIALDITSTIGVLTAVNLDNQPAISANEIYNERANGCLPNKLMAIEQTRS